MPVVTFSSPKGGCGKTTSCVVLATTLALKGADVIVIDADPNQNVVDWAHLPGVPEKLRVVSGATEENVVDMIEDASASASFVLIDLEGSASLMVSYAVSLSDFVIIPLQGSQLDAKQAARQMKLIKAQERVVGRTIPFAALFTRTNPALNPKTLRFIEERFGELGVPIFSTRLYDREAFRAIFSLGGTLPGLQGRGVTNLGTAVENAQALAAELIERLRTLKEAI